MAGRTPRLAWMKIAALGLALTASVIACAPSPPARGAPRSPGRGSPADGAQGGGGAGGSGVGGSWTDVTSTNSSTGTSPFGDGSSSSSGCPPPPPDFAMVTLAPTPPPAVSGGTMLIAADGVTAVAADPDRDAVYWTDVSASSPVVKTVALQPGDEPGRVVQDGAGLVHVALRRAGAVVTVDLVTGTLVRRTAVCAAPRGLAYDASLDAVVVACVGGELVTLAAADDTVLRTLHIDLDLRDVVSLGGGFLAVTKLRNAEVLLLDGTGAIRSRTLPTTVPGMDPREPTVAWRAVKLPGATGIALAHQQASMLPIVLGQPGGYSSCNGPGIVTSSVSLVRFDLTSPDAPASVTPTSVPGALAVDVAPASAKVAVASYGGQAIYSATVDSMGVPASPFSQTAAVGATSVAFDGTGRIVAFVREPAAFVVAPDGPQVLTIPVSAPSVRDTGHDLFHLASRPGGGLACASCHPEGREDGRVWQFKPLGPRRTKSLLGGVMASRRSTGAETCRLSAP